MVVYKRNSPQLSNSFPLRFSQSNCFHFSSSSSEGLSSSLLFLRSHVGPSSHQHPGQTIKSWQNRSVHQLLCIAFLRSGAVLSKSCLHRSRASESVGVYFVFFFTAPFFYTNHPSAVDFMISAKMLASVALTCISCGSVAQSVN